MLFHTIVISVQVMEYINTHIARFVLLLCMVEAARSEDPCESQYYQELNDPKRSTQYNSTNGLDDNGIVKAWVRPVSPLSYLMPTACILGGQRCGAKNPIWMNDTYPTNNEMKNVTMCATHQLGLGCCVTSYQIEVKHCGSYYVYHLEPTEAGGEQAYCFEPNITTESTTSSSDSTDSNTDSQTTNGVNNVATEATVTSSDTQSTTVTTTDSINSGETTVSQTNEITTQETTNGLGSVSENTKDKTALAFLIICSITFIGSVLSLCYLWKSSIKTFCTKVLRIQNTNVVQHSQRAFVQDNGNGVADLLINPQVTEVGRPPMQTNTLVK